MHNNRAFWVGRLFPGIVDRIEEVQNVFGVIGTAVIRPRDELQMRQFSGWAVWKVAAYQN